MADDVVRALFAAEPYFRRDRGRGDAPPDELLADYAGWKQEREGQLFRRYVQHCGEREGRARTLLDACPITLPNARKGVEYDCTFSLPGDLIPRDIEGLEALGLRWAEDDLLADHWTICGAPGVAGDHEIVLHCSYKGWVAGMPLLKRSLRLLVNPDPDDLWQDIPTDPGIEYFKPDTAGDFVPVRAEETATAAETGETAEAGPAARPVRPARRLLAASVRGRSHAHEGKPRDDHFLIRHDPESGWSLLIVADGAGSASFSREGSRIACETAAAYCANHIDDEAVRESIRLLGEAPEDIERRKQAVLAAYPVLAQAALEARLAICAEAEGKGRDKRDYATTLLLALCKRFDFGWVLMSFGVGDGAMGILGRAAPARTDGEAAPAPVFELLADPDEGEYSGQTRFLTMSDIFGDFAALSRRIRVRVFPDFTALMLMTDGVSDPKFGNDAALRDPAKWTALWEELNRDVPLNDDPEAAKNALLDWLTFRSPGHHDDRTLALFF